MVRQLAVIIRYPCFFATFANFTTLFNLFIIENLSFFLINYYILLIIILLSFFYNFTLRLRLHIGVKVVNFRWAPYICIQISKIVSLYTLLTKRLK